MQVNGGLVLRHLMSLAMIALTASIGVALFDLFVAFWGAPRRAAIWATLLMLSPPILSHAFLFFTEILSALVVLVVLARLRTSIQSPWAVTLLGATIGALMLIHARNVGLVIALGILGVYRLSGGPAPWCSCARLVAGIALSVAVRVSVTYHFWGSYITTPHARLGEFAGPGPTAIETVTRILGWLFDQEHGLLLYAPIYLVAPLGWWVLWKRNRELCWQVSVIVGIYIGLMALPMVNVHGWRGGWTPAGRFLVPVAPLLGVFVFAAVMALPRGLWAIRAVVLLQAVIGTYLWQNPKLLWNDGDGTSSFLTDMLAGSTALSRRFPTVGTPFDSSTMLAIAILVAFWVTFTVCLWRRVSQADQRVSGAG